MRSGNVLLPGDSKPTKKRVLFVLRAVELHQRRIGPKSRNVGWNQEKYR
jgi:hypothetical protein